MYPQPISNQLVHRELRSQLLAGIADFLYSSSPMLNIPSTIKYIRNIRIIRSGIVWLHKRVHGPPLRQNAAVADDHRIILNSDLYRATVHITVMDYSI